MREIENAARPILVPLIKGEAARISPAHQPLIATWATLKAMVTDYDDDLKITTHHMQRKRMFVQHLPPKAGWGIWIGNYERVHWKPEWISTPFLLLPNKRVIKRASRKATYYNSNSITQVIGNLFIQLVHTPMPRFIERWRFPLPQGRALFRIWPPTQFSINWPPPPAFTDADADRIANAIPQYLRRLERERLAQEQHSSDQK